MTSSRSIVGMTLAALLTAACNGSGDRASSGSTGIGEARLGGSAPVTAPSGCEFATLPSAEWSQCEQQNLAMSRQNSNASRAPMEDVAAASLAYQQARLQALLADPERQPNPNTCSVPLLCPIDPLLQNWAGVGGIVEPVLYTSRSGATMSAHVWATREGPAKRPGVVIINGSGIGYEESYSFAAQALARAGFVVMTFDVQGGGMSDQFGESPDQLEDAFAGTPGLGLIGAQHGPGGNGLTFYDGGADALDFFLSAPSHPYQPVPSRTSGTSHAAKQDRRVAAGLNAAFNPLWSMLDAGKIGLAGNSYGAVAASWLTQQESRVTTGVAWDSLCVPTWPSPDEATAFGGAPVNQVGGVQVPAPLYGFAPECFGAAAAPAPPITKPALGINSDYLLLPAPYLSPPRPQDKAAASLQYSAAGVDTGNITIRGGTHFEFNDAPGMVPATLRGIDLVTWYTIAWFSKYLQHNPDADRMLLTARWRDDAVAGAADPAGDPNMYSWHYASRLDIHLANGQRFRCENLRNGCLGQYTAAEDCGPSDFSFVSLDTSSDAPPPGNCSSR